MEKYTEEHWAEEMLARGIEVQLPAGLFSFGTALPCPRCNVIGFYGPRSHSEGESTRKYRACKFCGFWQEASGSIWNTRGGAPYRCIAVYCDSCRCYDWRLPWDYQPDRCSNCQNDVKEIEWASDDLNHPFHEIKEEILRSLQNAKPN